MASILWNLGEAQIIRVWLHGDSTGGISPAPPTVTTGQWGVGLGAGGVAATTTKTYVNGAISGTIQEIGQSTPNGYNRRPVFRLQDAASTGWTAATKPGTSYQTTSVQVTFGAFTSTGPSANGATLWFLASSTGVGNIDCLFGADLAATRTFTNGDTEKITITYQQS